MENNSVNGNQELSNSSSDESSEALTVESDADREYSLEQLRAMVTTAFLPAHATDYYGAVKQLYAALTERAHPAATCRAEGDEGARFCGAPESQHCQVLGDSAFWNSAEGQSHLVKCMRDEHLIHHRFVRPAPGGEVDANAAHLVTAYRENLCGDKECEGARFSAAATVLRGAVSHREVADAVVIYMDAQSEAGVGDAKTIAACTAPLTSDAERVREAEARDAAQRVVIEASKAAGYADSTWLDSRFKYELTERVVSLITSIRAEYEHPYPCQKCETPTVNVAEFPDVSLRCPKCGWEPVEVAEVRP